MSTDYPIAESSKVQFSVGEGSNRFDLTMSGDDYAVSVDDLSTEDLIAVAVKILRVASYWGADERTIEDAGKRALLYSDQVDVIRGK